MTPTYELDGIDLSNWRILHGSTYHAPVSADMSTVEIPGRHGHVAAGLTRFTAPLVTLILAPHGDGDPARLDERVASLRSAFAGPSAATLTRVTEHATSEAPARLVSLTVDNPGHLHGWRTQFTALLELPGVFWRDPVSTDLTIPAGTSTAAGAGSAPVADAVVRFAAAASFPSLVDVTSGTSISVERTMAAGRYCFVDLGNLRAWSSTSSSAWAGGTDESQYLSYGPAGPLQLWPRVAQPNADVTLQYDPATGRVTAPGSQILHHSDGRYTVGDVPVLTDGRGRYWLDTAATTRGYRVQVSHAAVVRARRAWL